MDNQKLNGAINELMKIMKRLRDKEKGCPWDKEQTHMSIRGCLIEEAYELVEAIEQNSRQKMLEECGDVLLQAVFHAALAEEEGLFDFADVVEGLNDKLYSRHTHIFGQNEASDAADALMYWEQAKAKEKSQKSIIDKVDSIPTTYSALMKADKTQKTIKKTGFDFKNVEDAYQKLYEEIDELKSAPEDKKEDEAGDVLFSAVNVIRMLGVNPEIALNNTTAKFKKRFAYVEKRAKEVGVDINKCSLEQMEAWYCEYKEKYEDR